MTDPKARDVITSCLLSVLKVKAIEPVIRLARVPSYTNLPRKLFVAWANKPGPAGVITYQVIVDVLPYGGCVSWLIPPDLGFPVPGLPNSNELGGG
ncbi:hypothetical protein [Streptomyces platensis]|uniref:hypothetical protein n=1 Tax=Streptomyces platensis TaxID=58346 RepID=UPI00117D18F6|nr:hypothetical protein [Streptomyces platensis]